MNFSCQIRPIDTWYDSSREHKEAQILTTIYYNKDNNIYINMKAVGQIVVKATRCCHLFHMLITRGCFLKSSKTFIGSAVKHCWYVLFKKAHIDPDVLVCIAQSIRIRSLFLYELIAFGWLETKRRGWTKICVVFLYICSLILPPSLIFIFFLATQADVARSSNCPVSPIKNLFVLSQFPEFIRYLSCDRTDVGQLGSMCGMFE